MIIDGSHKHATEICDSDQYSFIYFYISSLRFSSCNKITESQSHASRDERRLSSTTFGYSPHQKVVIVYGFWETEGMRQIQVLGSGIYV